MTEAKLEDTLATLTKAVTTAELGIRSSVLKTCVEQGITELREMEVLEKDDADTLGLNLGERLRLKKHFKSINAFAPSATVPSAAAQETETKVMVDNGSGHNQHVQCTQATITTNNLHYNASPKREQTVETSGDVETRTRQANTILKKALAAFNSKWNTKEVASVHSVLGDLFVQCKLCSNVKTKVRQDLKPHAFFHNHLRSTNHAINYTKYFKTESYPGPAKPNATSSRKTDDTDSKKKAVATSSGKADESSAAPTNPAPASADARPDIEELLRVKFKEKALLEDPLNYFTTWRDGEKGGVKCCVCKHVMTQSTQFFASNVHKHFIACKNKKPRGKKRKEVLQSQKPTPMDSFFLPVSAHQTPVDSVQLEKRECVLKPSIVFTSWCWYAGTGALAVYTNLLL